MKFIQANCRTQFTPADYDFIGSTMGGSAADFSNSKSQNLFRLFKDRESLDRILDHPKLFRAILDLKSCLPVSAHFYFYVLVRHVLLREDIRDPDVADYVAEVLTEFSMQHKVRRTDPNESRPLDYLHEMLLALDKLEDDKRFEMQTYIGNYALFLSGLFPQHLLRRMERRGAPGFRFYEELGGAHFRMAGNHRIAHKLDMVSIFMTLGQAFHLARLALNHLSENLVFLRTDKAVRDLLREVDGPEP